MLIDGWFPDYYKWAESNVGPIDGISGLLLDHGIKETFYILSKVHRFELLYYILYYIGVILFYIAVMTAIIDKRSNAGVFALIITALYLWVIGAGLGWVMYRFRHPMLPTFCILGGMGMAIIYKKLVRYSKIYE
ncbi:MAG: hypothetical protein HQK93_09505 [Nitrospirae bacterium]|nr:hypothetical protein [Nitrospirota bacterium]